MLPRRAGVSRLRVGAGAALLLAGALAGCTPKYPACNNDDDCNRDQPRGEVCVNQLCQKCRTDKDCKAGER